MQVHFSLRSFYFFVFIFGLGSSYVLRCSKSGCPHHALSALWTCVSLYTLEFMWINIQLHHPFVVGSIFARINNFRNEYVKHVRYSICSNLQAVFGICDGEKCVSMFVALQWFIWKSTTANCYSVALENIVCTIPSAYIPSAYPLVHWNAVNDFRKTQKKNTRTAKKKYMYTKQWHSLWAIELNGNFARAKPKSERNEYELFRLLENVNYVNWFSMQTILCEKVVLPFPKTRKQFLINY